MADLTKKQQMFVKEYLIDLNATQAAIRAGYSKKTAKDIACENLAKPYIATEIQKQFDKRSEKTEITSEYVLKTIKDTMELSKDDEDKPMIYKGAELLGKHLKLFTDKVLVGEDEENPISWGINIIDSKAKDG